MVLKCGVIAYGGMGDASSSLPTPQPRFMRDLYGNTGKAASRYSMSFVSQYAYDHGIKEALGLEHIVLPVHHTRNITKRDMIFNDYTPSTIRIDPQTFETYIDDELITCDPVDVVPLAQRYYLY